MSIKGLGALIIAGLLAALKIFSLKNKVLEKEKANLKQRADIADTTSASARKRDKSLSELDYKHQQETKDEKASLDKGDRNQLDSDW